MNKKSVKINEEALLNVVTKAINESLDNDSKDEKEKVEVSTDQEQWHNEYVNNDDNDVVQARVNPESGKEEYKIPTRDTVFTTKDAAISALNEDTKKKVVKLNENILRDMINEVMDELMKKFLIYLYGFITGGFYKVSPVFIFNCNIYN